MWFFDSNNSDEIEMMSCILLAYFFRGSKNFDMIKVLNFNVRLNDNDKLAELLANFTEKTSFYTFSLYYGEEED